MISPCFNSGMQKQEGNTIERASQIQDCDLILKCVLANAMNFQVLSQRTDPTKTSNVGNLMHVNSLSEVTCVPAKSLQDWDLVFKGLVNISKAPI